MKTSDSSTNHLNRRQSIGSSSTVAIAAAGKVSPLQYTVFSGSGLLAVLAGVLAFGPTPDVDACTGAVYFGKEGQTVTGRSMDWLEDMQSNLWIFPRGMKRDGGIGKGSFEWTSKYGSVITSIYEAGTADGLNE